MNTQKGTSFKVGNQYEFEALYKGFDEKLPFGFEVIKRTPKTVTVRYDSKNQAEQTFRIRLSGDHELININHIAGGELHTHKTLFAKNTTNQERGNEMENNYIKESYLKFVDGRWEKNGKKMAQNDEEKEMEKIYLSELQKTVEKNISKLDKKLENKEMTKTAHYHAIQSVVKEAKADLKQRDDLTVKELYEELGLGEATKEVNERYSRCRNLTLYHMYSGFISSYEADELLDSAGEELDYSIRTLSQLGKEVS